MNECDDVVVFGFVGDWSTVSVGSKREKCIEWDGEGRVEYKGWLSEWWMMVKGRFEIEGVDETPINNDAFFCAAQTMTHIDSGSSWRLIRLYDLRILPMLVLSLLYPLLYARWWRDRKIKGYR